MESQRFPQLFVFGDREWLFFPYLFSQQKYYFFFNLHHLLHNFCTFLCSTSDFLHNNELILPLLVQAFVISGSKKEFLFKTDYRLQKSAASILQRGILTAEVL